jgi:hypothetical protein
VPSRDPRWECRGVASQLGELLHASLTGGVAVDDVSVKNARLGLEIGNHTSHRFLRSVGHVPLQQAREDGKCEDVRA